MGPATNKDREMSAFFFLVPLLHNDMVVCMWFGDSTSMCLSHEIMQEREELCADKDSHC